MYVNTSELDTTLILNITETIVPNRHLSPGLQVVITTCYMLGILGNLLALIFVCRKETSPNNLKHRLMLKCLSVNDLLAMVGMLVLMYMQLYLPFVRNNIWFCRARVVWRVFGLGSGCVAIVMAIERWLAMTKPFFYQKYVTVLFIKRCIFVLWISAVMLACMPFVGFGLYYRQDRKECVRYRTGTSLPDIIYAYLYFTLGMLLCACILYFNVAVMITLRNNGTYSWNSKPVLIRRVSRSCSKMSNTSTREELAFARLMGLLCFIFLVCWMPQMITIPLAQMDLKQTQCTGFFRIADILMAFHFLFDPYVYVIQRLPTVRSIFKVARPANLQRSIVKAASYDPTIQLTKL